MCHQFHVEHQSIHSRQKEYPLPTQHDNKTVHANGGLQHSLQTQGSRGETNPPFERRSRYHSPIGEPQPCQSTPKQHHKEPKCQRWAQHSFQTQSCRGDAIPSLQRRSRYYSPIQEPQPCQSTPKQHHKKPKKKAPKTRSRKQAADDDDNEEEEAKPAPKKARGKKAAAKTDDSDAKVVPPNNKAAAAKKFKAAAADKPEPEPAKEATKGGKAKAKKEASENENEEEVEEAAKPAAKKGKAKKAHVEEAATSDTAANPGRNGKSCGSGNESEIHTKIPAMMKVLKLTVLMGFARGGKRRGDEGRGRGERIG
ncbi:unnamed protein product [Zymoseptoria tritici ST99CH_3D7]|uniref:Uncharacterized protein n=1 Tax=Zymoseptoria tritici (strain ST99CH_3D7) TaxID=1276538 RepID=A0A1X7RDM4_ZYMT9|nr:unnamed protein product [Zymoseptoria tritici ST99CH_3D7]